METLGLSQKEHARTYNAYAKEVPEQTTMAYEEVRFALRRAAERNKRYYDVA